MELHFLKKWAFPIKRLDPACNDILTRERGQATLRVVICVILLLYLVGAFYPIDVAQGIPFWLIFLMGYVAFSVFLLWRIWRSNSSPVLRRFLGNVGDMTTISYLMIATGETGIPLFVLYLWVTFGNGFRYGVPALIVSTILSVIGFSTVVSFTQVWQAHTSLVVGVFLSLIILPLYAGHLLRLLNSALARANEASAAKSQFLARMSHELRTPLNGILGSAELLRESRRLVPEERSLLDVIEDSVNVSLRQINNVLDFSKLEAGKLILEKTDIDLHTLLNGTASMVRPAATQKGLRFLVRIAPDVPFNLAGDGHHLREILLNLLANAVRFTDQGSVWLDVTNEEENPESVIVRFEVRDTGNGISPEALERIFDSFTQEDTSTTRSYGGTGLGTTIAKQLVEIMGGQIGVESVKGRGSMFWFEIPFEKRPVSEDENVPSAEGRVVLLSEDPELLESYQQSFSQGLTQSVSSDEAIGVLARTIRLGNPVSFVLVDETMALDPGGDNRCTDLCEKAASANVPMILVSDNPPATVLLREWGYSAVLPRTPEPRLIHAVLRASPSRLVGADPKLMTVPPWLWGGRESERPRILVADDNRTNLMITRRILEQAGFDVDVVETGDEALERLYGGGYRLAVLDMHMPGLDGTSVLRQYRMMRPRSPLPVIVLTANASLAAQQACAEVGADAYLAKPVTARQLLDEVKLLLEETQVEVLSWNDLRRGTGTGEKDKDVEDVIDISVLAELDRIYSDPQELTLLAREYAHEGGEILQRIATACQSHNHPAFCDAVHALKSNAANVGARRLMHACSDAGAIGIVEFSRDRMQYLAELQEAFTASLAALQEIAKSSPPEGRDKSTG